MPASERTKKKQIFLAVLSVLILTAVLAACQGRKREDGQTPAETAFPMAGPIATPSTDPAGTESAGTPAETGGAAGTPTGIGAAGTPAGTESAAGTPAGAGGTVATPAGTGGAAATPAGTDAAAAPGETGKPSGSGTGAPASGENSTPGNASGGSTPAEPDAAAPAGLKVIGTQLCEAESGRPIQLRGISTHGLAWYPDYVNEACFRELRDSWHVNVIRLALYTAEYGGYCTGGDREALKKLVCSGVEYATKLNLYVILDWHVLSEHDPNTYKADAIAFFDEMSKKYADRRNILYEICNEPNGVSWQAVKSYAEEVIPVIRANDPDAVILVGTSNWCQSVDQAAADPITGYGNLLYTLHFYADTHRGELRSRMESAVRAGLPIFVSEYGLCDASGSGAINREESSLWIQAMDRLGISYAAWNLSNKNETSALLKPSCTKKSGFSGEDLSESGKWLYEMLTGEHTLPAPSAAPSKQPAAPTQTAAPTQPATPAQTAAPTQPAGPTAPPAALLHPDWTAKLVNRWESGGLFYSQYTLVLTNRTEEACAAWEVQLSFENAITLCSGWNGEYAASGNVLRIGSMPYNGAIPAGGSLADIGFIVCGEKECVLSGLLSGGKSNRSGTDGLQTGYCGRSADGADGALQTRKNFAFLFP